jgi:hypothetical protein
MVRAPSSRGAVATLARVRHRAWVSLLCALTIVLAGTGVQASGASPGAAKAEAGKEELGKGKKRPGCRRFCQQAGGFGGGDDVDDMPVQIREQTIGGTRDRIVSVQATCALATDCVGAIILNNRKIEYGRADLEIPAGQTKDVPVGISRSARDWLEEHGKDEKAFATVPLVETQVLSVSERLTILAP